MAFRQVEVTVAMFADEIAATLRAGGKFAVATMVWIMSCSLAEAVFHNSVVFKLFHGFISQTSTIVSSPR